MVQCLNGRLCTKQSIGLIIETACLQNFYDIIHHFSLWQLKLRRLQESYPPPIKYTLLDIDVCPKPRVPSIEICIQTLN